MGCIIGRAYSSNSNAPDLQRDLARHCVDAVRQVSPFALDTFDVCDLTQNTICTSSDGDSCDFARELTQEVHHAVDGCLQLVDFSFGSDLDLLRQITLGNGSSDSSNRSDLILAER